MKNNKYRAAVSCQPDQVISWCPHLWRNLVLRFTAFDGTVPFPGGSRVLCPWVFLPPCPSSQNAVRVLPLRSLETRLGPFSASLLQVFLEFGKLTRDFGGRRVCHGEGSLLEHRISALSWPPTSSSELQTKSSFCLAGSVLPTSGPKDPDFYF